MKFINVKWLTLQIYNFSDYRKKSENILMTYYSEFQKCIDFHPYILGLKEGSLVKCSLVPDTIALDSVSVTAQSQKDWEMLVSEGFIRHQLDVKDILNIYIGSE